MSSPSEPLECRWQPSRQLLAAYLLLQALALLALLLADLAIWGTLVGALICAAHALWVVPRWILLRSPSSVQALRQDATGWHLYTPAQGWQRVQLRPDSLALPTLIVIRYRRPDRWTNEGLCLPRDTLSADQHRRLRVRLKFSRHRWESPDARP